MKYQLFIIIRNHCVDLFKLIFTSCVNCGLFEMSRKNMQLIIGKYTHGSNEDRQLPTLPHERIFH